MVNTKITRLIMRLILLRHEERDPSDCSFSSMLTERGVKSANTTLKQQLQKYTEDSTNLIIFSSPFVRCLETILPYVKEKRSLVNLDYSLMESLFPDENGKYPKKYVNLKTPPLSQLFADVPESEQCTNPVYPSLVTNSISMCTTEEQLNERILKFIEKRIKPIFQLYNNPTSTILICTHQRVVQTIGPLIYNYFTNEPYYTKTHDDFKPVMGSFYVYDSKSSQVAKKVVPLEYELNH